ncbi:hypothetical protein RB597_006219 [Gaeumannomyces tritici]
MSATPTSECRSRLLGLCLTAALDISSEAAAAAVTASNSNSSSSSGGDTRARHPLAGCGGPLVRLLGRQASVLTGLCLGQARTAAAQREADVETPVDADGHHDAAPPGSPGEEEEKEEESCRRRQRRLLHSRLDDLISLSYGRFYAHVFSELPACWRQLYTDASILKFTTCLLEAPPPPPPGDLPDDSAIDTLLDELVKPLDLALVLAGGAGHKRGREWIDQALDLLDTIYNNRAEDNDRAAASPDRTIPTTDDYPAPRPKKPRLSEDPRSRGGGGGGGGWEGSPSFSTAEPFTPPIRSSVRRVPRLSMVAFQTYMSRPPDPSLGPEPLVVAGLTDDWPARTTRPWSRPAYLLSRTLRGRRLVPVEIGRSYVDDGWGQKIIPFADFLRTYIDATAATTTAEAGVGGSDSGGSDGSPSSTLPREQQVPVAYLAQHQLFSQLPRLRDDIRIPDYCYTSPPPPPPSLLHGPEAGRPPPAELDEPVLNAWLGPPGTITPLHTDPYHNVLAQVVGRKYVRLYAPRHSPRMAAHGTEAGVDMGNTSAFDVGALEGWDDAPAGEEEKEEEEGDNAGQAGRDAAAAAAAFREIPFVDCILEPGDSLYIPAGWWHYVRGLSVSFSVSFWWN